jgi:Lon protease-like protein
VDTAPPSHVLATLIAHHWPVAAAARAREIKAQRRAPRLTYGVMVLASGALHFPGQTTKLFIYEPRYRVMVNRVMPTHRSFVITSLDSLPASVAQMIHLDGDWGEHDSFPARARGRGPSSVAAAAGLYDHGPRSEPAAPPSAVAAAAALGSESAGVSADSSSAAFDPASAPAPATAPDAPEPEPMGVMFHILTCRSYPDGRLVVRGECRERVTLTRPSIDPTTFGLLVSEVQPMEDLDDVDDHPDLPAPEHAQGQQEGAQQQQEQQHGDVQSAAAALGVDPVAEEADADAVAAGGLRQRRVSASTNAGPSDSAGAGAGASAGAGAGAGAGASAGRSAIVSAPAISADDAGQAADAAAAAVAAAAASGHTTPHAAAASAATVLPGVLSMISLYFDRANVPLHRIAERFGDVPSDPVRIPFWVCTAIPGSDDLKLLCLRSRLHTERLLIADAILRAGLRGGGFFSRFSGQKVLLTAFLLLVLYKFFTGPQ